MTISLTMGLAPMTISWGVPRIGGWSTLAKEAVSWHRKRWGGLMLLAKLVMLVKLGGRVRMRSRRVQALMILRSWWERWFSELLQVWWKLLLLGMLRPVHINPDADIPFDLTECDIAEDDKVQAFMTTGCKCSKACSLQFDVEYVKLSRAFCSDLTHTELDMVLMGQLRAFTNSSKGVVTESRHRQQERKQKHATYYHQAAGKCLSSSME